MFFMLAQQTRAMRAAWNRLAREAANRGTVLAEGSSASRRAARRDLLRIMYRAVTTLSV